MECVFCAILKDELPSSRVYEDEQVVAFMDIAPVSPGHLLVIPRQHAPYLADLDPQDAERMMSVAQRLAQGIRDSSLSVDGINLLLADGEAAGQEVWHAHLHVIPRVNGDGAGFGRGSNDGSAQPRESLEEHAAAIRTAL